VDFVEKDKDFFVPIIGVKLEVGIGERGKVGKGERKKPVIFKVDVKETITENGRNGVGAEIVNKLVDKVSFTASAGAGNGNNRRRTG
jgi:hypothetical protein